MHFLTFKSALVTWERNYHCFGNLHMASAFYKSPYVSNFESKCPSNTSEFWNMSFLFLEIHSLRNYHHFPYKWSIDSSAREGIILVNKCLWISIERVKVLICCWLDVGCDEAGMKLELVASNQSLVVTSPLYYLINIVFHFPIYVSLYVSISHAMDSWMIICFTSNRFELLT